MCALRALARVCADFDNMMTNATSSASSVGAGSANSTLLRRIDLAALPRSMDGPKSMYAMVGKVMTKLHEMLPAYRENVGFAVDGLVVAPKPGGTLAVDVTKTITQATLPADLVAALAGVMASVAQHNKAAPVISSVAFMQELAKPDAGSGPVRKCADMYAAAVAKMPRADLLVRRTDAAVLAQMAMAAGGAGDHDLL